MNLTEGLACLWFASKLNGALPYIFAEPWRGTAADADGPDGGAMREAGRDRRAPLLRPPPAGVATTPDKTAKINNAAAADRSGASWCLIVLLPNSALPSACGRTAWILHLRDSRYLYISPGAMSSVTSAQAVVICLWNILPTRPWLTDTDD